jgi:hypothetical protein
VTYIRNGRVATAAHPQRAVRARSERRGVMVGAITDDQLLQVIDDSIVSRWESTLEDKLQIRMIASIMCATAPNDLTIPVY